MVLVMVDLKAPWERNNQVPPCLSGDQMERSWRSGCEDPFVDLCRKAKRVATGVIDDVGRPLARVVEGGRWSWREDGRMVDRHRGCET